MSDFFQLQFLLVLASFTACQDNKVPVSNPVISAKINYKVKEIVITTICCLSSEGSLPIHYTLFKSEVMMRSLQAELQRKAEFVVQLTNHELQEILKCKAENGFGPKYSRGLVIDWSVKMTSYPDPPIPGQQLTLNCTVSYETKAKYEWHFEYPSKNETKVTEENQIIIEAAKSGIYYCLMHDQISNKIEVPVQDFNFQPVAMGVSIAAILVIILTVGLICYCSMNKAHRFNSA